MIGKLRNVNTNKAEIGGMIIKNMIHREPNRPIILFLSDQEYYDKMFKNIQNNMKSPPYQERVTGIMIIYPTLMIQVIEVGNQLLQLYTCLET
jgi:hypothetical protein